MYINYRFIFYLVRCSNLLNNLYTILFCLNTRVDNFQYCVSYNYLDSRPRRLWPPTDRNRSSNLLLVRIGSQLFVKFAEIIQFQPDKSKHQIKTVIIIVVYVMTYIFSLCIFINSYNITFDSY